MAVREYYGLSGQLVTTLAPGSTAIAVDTAMSGAIVASGFVNGQDETYFALEGGGKYEIVKVLAVNGNILSVEREIYGEASPQPVGTKLSYVVTSYAIIAGLGNLSPNVVLEGTGITTTQKISNNEYTINTVGPNFSGRGIRILGTYPDIEFVALNANGCEADDGVDSEGITQVTPEGLVSATVNGQELIIGVEPPQFTAGTNIQIDGAWPNYTITATAGSGTVGEVGVGTGLTLTGNPSVNPNISLSNTGVVAGTYGGVAINAQGQITAVPLGFNPISEIVAEPGISAVRTGGTYTLTAAEGAIGVPGMVALADHTDPFDPNDSTNAATPAVVAAALATLVTGSAAGASNFTPEAGTEYTNIIGATTVAVQLADNTQKALVIAEVTAVDGSDPALAPLLGIAVYDAAPAILKGNRKIGQSQQQISFIITGPFNSSVTLVTTALPTGVTIQSYSLSVLKV